MKLDKQKIKARVIEEIKSAFFLTIYLSALFGTLTVYKRLILAEHEISFGEYGVSVIEALVLAKVMLVGAAFRVGSRFNDRPLIIPALYKTFCFSCIMLAVALAERIIKGLWSGDSVAAILNNCMAEKWVILSRIVMLFIALIPLFAFWETNRVIGGDVLRRLFFKQQTPGAVKLVVQDDVTQKS